MRRTHARRKLDAASNLIEAQMTTAIQADLNWLYRQVQLKIRRINQFRPRGVARHRMPLQKNFMVADDMWSVFKRRMQKSILKALLEGSILLAAIMGEIAGEPFEFDTESFVALVEPSIGKRIRDVETNIKREVGRKIVGWYNSPGTTMQSLINQLQPKFGLARAANIAQNEVTHLHSSVLDLQMQKLGLTEWWWSSKQDQTVCKKPLIGPDGNKYNGCRELHGHVFKAGDKLPPDGSHIGCRCRGIAIVPRVQVQPSVTFQQQMLGIRKFDFVESEHPRDDSGKFTDKGAGGFHTGQKVKHGKTGREYTIAGVSDYGGSRSYLLREGNKRGHYVSEDELATKWDVVGDEKVSNPVAVKETAQPEKQHEKQPAHVGREYSRAPKTASQISGHVPERDGKPVPVTTVKAYHVTRRENLDSILKNGFDLSRIKPRWINDYAVSLTHGSLKQGMKYFMENTPGATFDNEKYAVVEVTVSGRFYDEYDQVRYPGAGAQGWTREAVNDGWDAQDGGAGGGAMYVYNPQAISNIREVEPDKVNAINEKFRAMKKAEWQESEHPRAKDGEFTEKGSGSYFGESRLDAKAQKSIMHWAWNLRRKTLEDAKTKVERERAYTFNGDGEVKREWAGKTGYSVPLEAEYGEISIHTHPSLDNKDEPFSAQDIYTYALKGLRAGGVVTPSTLYWVEPAEENDWGNASEIKKELERSGGLYNPKFNSREFAEAHGWKFYQITLSDEDLEEDYWKLIKAVWEEQKHPRKKDGKFAPKGGGEAGGGPGTAQHERAAGKPAHAEIAYAPNPAIDDLPEVKEFRKTHYAKAVERIKAFAENYQDKINPEDFDLPMHEYDVATRINDVPPQDAYRTYLKAAHKIMDGKVDEAALTRLENAIRVGDWRFIKNLKLPPKPVKVKPAVKPPDAKPLVVKPKPVAIKPFEREDLEDEKDALFDRDMNKLPGVTAAQVARQKKRALAYLNALHNDIGRQGNRTSIKSFVDKYINNGWLPKDPDRPYVLISPDGSGETMFVGQTKLWKDARNYLDLVMNRGDYQRNYDVVGDSKPIEKPEKPMKPNVPSGDEIAKQIMKIQRNVSDPEAHEYISEAKKMREQLKEMGSFSGEGRRLYNKILQYERHAEHLNREARQKKTDEMRHLFIADKPNTFKGDIDKTLQKDYPEAANAAEEGVAMVQNALSASVALNLNSVGIIYDSAGRASYHSDENYIHINKYSTPKTVAHEIGHYLEHNNRGARHAVRDFLRRRTANEKAVPINSCHGCWGYDANEICKPDKFFKAYVGKIYTDGATEVLSMGLQEYVTNPIEFCKKDPEHFALIYNICHGLYEEG